MLMTHCPRLEAVQVQSLSFSQTPPSAFHVAGADSRCMSPESSLRGLIPIFPGTTWLPDVSQAVFLTGLIEDI